MTTLAPWDIVVAIVLLGALFIVLMQWTQTMSRKWRIIWMMAIAVPIAVELWAQFDNDPLTFTFSEGLTRSFTLKELWVGGTIIYLVLQIHWPDLVRRGYGIIKRRMAK